LFALPLKAQLGEEPSKLDYQNAASGLNSWMQRTFSSEIMRTGGVGFAEGGKVEAGMFSNGEDMTRVIEKSLEESISSKVTASINDLKKQLGLEPDGGNIKEGTAPSIETGGDVQGAELSGSMAQKAYQLGKIVQSRFGLKDFQAAAIVGTWLREGFGSGYPDVMEGGKRGAPTYNAPSTGGYGFAQWTNTEGGGPNDRLNRALIFLGMKDSPRPWTVDDNLKVFEWEIKKNYSSLMPELKKTTNIKDAVRTFVGIYEAGGMSQIARYESKEGGGFIGRRLSSAQSVLKTLQTNKDDQGNTLETAQTTSGAGGNVGGDGKFIQGNSGNSRGIHFHIGPGSQEKGTILQSRYYADARSTAKQVIKHFLGKKSMHDGRSGKSYTSGSDDEIKAAQDAHTYGSNKGSPGGIDIQVGGAYYPGAKVPFPLNTQSMKFRPNGFGVSADISGSNSFVAHGYKDEMGKVASQNGGLGNLYAFHGKIGFASRDNIILKLHKGEMFKVVDKDSVDLFGTSLVQDIIDIENKSQLISRVPHIIEKLKQLSGYISPNESQIAESVSSKSDMSILQSYAPYERSNQEIVVQLPPPEIVEVFVPIPMGGSASYGGGSGSDPYESLVER
jgi:hypothetical protein